MTAATPRKQQLRQWRARGHALKPVLTVAGNGISDGVLAELERALDDHELIKVRIAVGDRAARQGLAEGLCAASGATLLQTRGATALLLRRNPKANSRLFILLRPR